MKPIKDIIKEEVGAYIHKALKATNTTGRDTDIKPEFNENFWRWFEGSKVVNPDGSPKLMYHGTTADFSTFEKGVFGFHFGTYQQAKDILMVKRGEYTQASPTLDAFGNKKFERTYGKGSSMMLVYLSIKNPIEIQDPGEDEPDQILLGVESHLPQEDAKYLWTLIPNSVEHNLGGYGLREKLDYARKEIIRILLKNGYDGLKYENAFEGLHYSTDHEAWIAFLPEQIKSATGNNGEYSDSPDITKETLEVSEAKVDNSQYFNENFWNWFGQSKVVDGRGNPLRVYHGTQKDFSEFASNSGLYYFSHTPKYASAFAMNPQIKRSETDSQRSVMPVYLSVQKPLDLRGFENDIVSRYEFAAELEERGVPVDSNTLKDFPFNLNIGEDVRAWQWLRFNDKYLVPLIKSAGFDGIFMYEHADYETKYHGPRTIEDVAYVVFNPTQIKSATGNNGDFNPSNPDITKESIEEQLIRELSSLVEGVESKPRILTIIDDYENASRAADDQAFNTDTPNSSWRGTFDSAMSPRAGVQYDEFMKNQPNIELQQQKALELQQQAQRLADEIRNEYQWYWKSVRGKGMKKYAGLDDMIKFFKQKYGITEGIADKAAERMFNIPSDIKGQELKASAEVQKGLEEPVGYVKEIKYDYKNGNHKFLDNVPVYLNPKSLTYIDGYVRAIVDTKGNLYVAQRDGKFAHGDISVAIGLHDRSDAIYVDTHKYTLLGRIGETDSFGLGDTAEHYIKRNNEYYEIVHEMLINAKKKNPEYDFYEAYYEDRDLGEPVDPNEEKPSHKELRPFNYSELVHEEIQNIVDGVADKYAEREFNIPDTTKSRSVAEKPYKIMTIEVPEWLTGVPDNLQKIPVYLNPRSLEGFERDVRAISDADGNLYVAQIDGNFVHGQMAKELGLTADDGIGMTLYQQMNRFQLLHRVGDDNSFGLADSAAGYKRQDEESKKISIELLRKAKQKNSQFEYYPEYYRNVEAYDTDPIDASGNDIYNEETYDEDNIGDDNGLTTKDLIGVGEGVADKYAEKQFGIPDPNKAMDYQATIAAPEKDDSMGEYIGDILEYGRDDDDYQYRGEPMNLEVEARVFANPRTLKDFDRGVRAVSDKDGNLFIADNDGRFFHDNLISVVRKSKYGNSNTTYMEWYRQGNTDMFAWSTTYTNFNPLKGEKEQEYIRAIQAGSPQFNFLVPEEQMTTEGVADKFAEKEFGLPNDYKDQERQAIMAIEPEEKSPMGELVGPIKVGLKKNESNIYVNPQSLEGFEPGVRALSDHEGNLFVAQQDGRFVHYEFGRAINASGKYNIGDAYSEVINILWMRVKNSNVFGLSDSMEKSLNNPDRFIKLKKRVDDLQQKHPQFKFVPQTYWLVKVNGELKNPHEPLDVQDYLGLQESIKEQLIRELTILTEGVADKYAERAFNIPDPNKSMEKQAIAGIKDLPPEENEPVDTSKGTLVGEFPIFDHGKYQQVPVYQNPRQLKDFNEDVKAVSNKVGDIFVAQLDLAFYHDDIIGAVKSDGVYPQQVYNAYDESENITWHRIGNTNDFGWSVSYRRFGSRQENQPTVKAHMDAVKAKNPQYNFIPRYWEEIKQMRYDEKNNINNQNLNSEPPKSYPIYNNMREELNKIVKEELFELNEVKTNVLAKLNEDGKYNFTEEDLDNCWRYYKSYLVDILNGEYDLDTAREDLQSLIGSEFDLRTKKANNALNENNLNEQVYKVYHGTNEKFDKFDFNRATQGIVWFTDSIDSIKKGEHGGQGSKYIMTRYIVINNPAGWQEYEKYGLQQLEDMGYDGVILPQGDKTDYFVFSNKSIRTK